MKQNLKNGVAVQGYDTVTFFDGNAMKGKELYSTNYNNATYYFISEENKAKFKATTEKYVPQYGGFCAIAMSEGKEVDPNPKSFLIQNGKLYLFTRMLFGIIDAKRQWIKDPNEKKALADKEWGRLNAS